MTEPLDGVAPAAPAEAAGIGVFLRRQAVRLELDRSISYAVSTRIWTGIAGPISLVLIARYLTAPAQGYYYTFGSLLGLQSFFELSLYMVIINVVSHEWAHLRLEADGTIGGDAEALSRLNSIARLVFRWYAAASALFVVGVATAGLFFFADPKATVNWRMPWVSLVLLTGLLLWCLPFNSILEGCNQVETVQKFRLSQSMLGSIALWISLIAGAGLWVTVISAAASVVRDLYLLLVRFRRFFASFLRPPSGSTIHWWRDIWPLQWQLAVASITSYFAYAIFNPIMFHYHGPAEAGRLGMTLAAVMAAQTLSQAWISTKAPRFGMFVAHRDFHSLDRLWWRASITSVAVMCAGGAALLAIIAGVNRLGLHFATRILPVGPAALFVLAAIFMQVSQCQTAYIMAHKKAPFAVQGAVSSIAIGLLAWVLGRKFGAIGIGAGYALVMGGFVIPWETRLYRICRAEQPREA